MKKIIAGVVLLVLGLAGLAGVYSARPLSVEEMTEIMIERGGGAFGHNSFEPPVYQALLAVTGLCALSGIVLIVVGWSAKRQ